MMKKNKIFFIVNALHSKKNKNLKKLIRTKFLSEKYDVNILISEYNVTCERLVSSEPEREYITQKAKKNTKKHKFMLA